MTIKEVTSKTDIREFLLLPVRLYAENPKWIRPLNQDLEKVFDPKLNKTFRHGECIRWIVRNANHETVGRVAAFVNQKTVNKGNDQPTGGIGFFECVNDQEVAFLLFDQSKAWLEERGMEAMDGPVNFGPRDRWWGLLIEGFDREPNYQCNYNFPYYKDLFEAYGFQVYFYQLTFGRKVMGPLTDRLAEKAELVAKDPNYSFRHVDKIDVKKLASDIRYIYNKAWAKRGETPELNESQSIQLVKQMKPVMDKKLLWFGYYKDEPVIFFLSLPEVNQIFKHVNGNFNWFGKLKFVWHQWRGTARKAFGVLFGIIPEHHGKGLDGGIIMAMRKLMQEEYLRYDDYEMNWIGDFNPKMIRIAEQINTEVVKRHATYRYLFDRSKPFKRYPILN
ncbi:MAG: hypothetical protein HC811_00050 [Flammeovirgaceae bacterium]|nr:hypothetical protein [Flammeovirgaceae bacterium]